MGGGIQSYAAWQQTAALGRKRCTDRQGCQEVGWEQRCLQGGRISARVSGMGAGKAVLLRCGEENSDSTRKEAPYTVGGWRQLAPCSTGLLVCLCYQKQQAKCRLLLAWRQLQQLLQQRQQGWSLCCCLLLQGRRRRLGSGRERRQ